MKAYRGSRSTAPHALQRAPLSQWIKRSGPEADQAIPTSKFKNDRIYIHIPLLPSTCLRGLSTRHSLLLNILLRSLCFLLNLFKDAILSVQSVRHGERKVVMKGNVRRSYNLSYLGRLRMVTKNLCQATEGLNQDSSPALV